MRAANSSQQGFSLIEVCLAMLVVGFGFVTLFGLFPSGLRSAEDAVADTRCGLFAETVMNGMRANAALIMSSNDWYGASFTNRLLAGVLPSTPVATSTPGVSKVQFPAGGNWLRYQLILDIPGHSARLDVCDGEYGSFSLNKTTVYTEFYFQGM